MRKFVMRTAPVLMALCVTLVTGCGSSVSEKTLQTDTGTFENSTLLVSMSELAASIDNPNQVSIDVRSAADYNAGHIRNAVNLPPGTFDKGGTGIDSKNLKSPEEIAVILGAAGISTSTKIIVYGKNVDSNAGRVF
jgi:3-mercaptopyruvate sulfurtransferase SseA